MSGTTPSPDLPPVPPARSGASPGAGTGSAPGSTLAAFGPRPEPDDPHACLLVELLSHRVGTLIVDDLGGGTRATPVRFVIHPVEPAIIFVCPVSDLDPSRDGGSGVLCVPEEHEDALRLELSIDACDEAEHGDLMDRWSAYHGAPAAAAPGHKGSGGIAWAFARIESLRQRTNVADIDEIDLRNPLHGKAEFARLRSLNADAESLARQVGEPGERVVAVGADALGVDVRARLGVRRLWWAS